MPVVGIDAEGHVIGGRFCNVEDEIRPIPEWHFLSAQLRALPASRYQNDISGIGSGDDKGKR